MGTETRLRNFIPAILIVFALLLFASPATGAEPMESSLASGGKVRLQFLVEPLKTMTETPFEISLLDSAGNPETDAELAISLDMPAMPMPPNHPKVEFRDDRYRGTAIFTMAGAWQVEITIRRVNRTAEQVIFDIEKVMMK